MNRLFTEMVEAVEAEGGVIRQFTGDGVMALFGAPVLHDDDPARAVRAALGMVARLPAVNASLAAEGIGVAAHRHRHPHRRRRRRAASGRTSAASTAWSATR